MNDIRIRTMHPDDYEKAYSLWLSCEGMGLNSIDDSFDGICAFLNRNPTTCFVAFCGERIIGTILAGHDGRRGHIYHTAVAKGFRRIGIASKLVDLALEALGDCGITKAALVAFKSNAEGNTFWEARNFSERDDLVYRNIQLKNKNKTYNHER